MRAMVRRTRERLRTGRRYRTDRTEGISDGVFAVSLTLLILDVRPPEGAVSQLVHGLVLIAPRLGTFALSFAIALNGQSVADRGRPSSCADAVHRSPYWRRKAAHQ